MKQKQKPSVLSCSAVIYALRIVLCAISSILISQSKLLLSTFIIHPYYRGWVTVTGGRYSASFTGAYNTWTHYGLIYKGDPGGVTLYKDGYSKVSSSSRGGTTTNAPTGRLLIGKGYTNNNPRHSKADVDELMFWNRELSPEEIRKIMNMA